MPHYRIDLRDTARSNQLVAKRVDIVCDMWHLPEEILILKLSTSSAEMGKKENKDKLSYRLPERDYRATVKKVIEIERLITTDA